MSENNNKTLIIGFTAILIIIIAIVVIFHKKDSTETAPVVNNNAGNAAVENNIPDGTKGDMDATINTNISYRDVDFSLSQDEVISREEGLDDSLGEPTISKSSDGYTYIYYASNPSNPLSYNNISVGTTGAPGLTYVYHNDSLEEVRLQFGQISQDSFNALLAGINTQYGEYTFYRAQSGTETYWWKSSGEWLMLTKDSYSTSLFLRQN